MLEFCEPPPLKRGGGRHRNNQFFLDMAEELRAQPGQWAKWPIKCASPYAVSSHIKQDRYASLPGRDFEAIVRESQLYIRARRVPLADPYV